MSPTRTTKDGTPVDLFHFRDGLWEGACLFDGIWVGIFRWRPDGKCVTVFDHIMDLDLTEPPGRGEEE